MRGFLVHTFAVGISILCLNSHSLGIERISLGKAKASFIGEGENLTSAFPVCIAGDVNGDGYDDVLVGGKGKYTSYMRTGAGQTYVIFGKVTGWRMKTNLAQANASFVGEFNSDVAGSTMDGVGDVNGDGFDDILIGANQNDFGGRSSGQSYLIFGKADGWEMRVNLSEADASFIGEEAYDLSGLALAGIGDVNGDGYDDFLIGRNAEVSMEYSPDLRKGKAYLFFGKPMGWNMRTSLAEADVVFLGGVSLWSGMALAGGGDVNADGFDDFIIAAHWKDENWEGSADVHLFFGRPEGWDKETLITDCDITFTTTGWFSFNGSIGLRDCWSASITGDLNGDGYDDILLGAPWKEREAGKTYLVFGRPGETGSQFKLDLEETASASFIGERPGYWAGRVCDGGDINGDGYDDILIGSYLSAHGGIKAGETYLIYGKPAGWTKDLNLSQADLSFLGEEPEDGSGYVFSHSGDINGDGLKDILIGSPGNDSNGTNTGQTYILCTEERKGDVNFDGQINTSDVIMAVNILTRLVHEPPGRVWAADYNDDEMINVLDIIQIINNILEDE